MCTPTFRHLEFKQSFSFPSRWMLEMFRTTPSLGTTPSRMLNDRFKYLRACSFWRSSGIDLESWFEVKSSTWKPFICPSVVGIGPENLLLAMTNSSKLLQFLIELGILPGKRFLERSMVITFSKKPIALGKAPLRKLLERLKTLLR